ncbi:MAG: hypothetical protein ACREI2_06235 [Nitrospiraceae bacterium]
MSLAESIRQKMSASPWRQFGHLLIVAFLAAIASAIFFKPVKSNGTYLRELIESHALEKTAAELVVRLRASPETKHFTDTEWKRIEEGLAACLVKQAEEHAASNDPYLSARANMETPTVLANRFLKACGALEYDRSAR